MNPEPVIYEDNKDILKDLNKHFKTAVLERYPQAMLDHYIKTAIDKEFKNKPKTSKISDSTRKRLINHLLKELKTHYGEWANIYNFDRKFRCYSNFELIYKTEFGRLYGSYPGTYQDHLFYTAHCFEQFRERYNEEYFKFFKLAFQRVKLTDPNPADYLRTMAIVATEYCETTQFIYVNVWFGVLVVEKITEKVLVAKTFLTPEMDYPKENWKDTPLMGSMLSITRTLPGMIEPTQVIPPLQFCRQVLEYDTCYKFLVMQKSRPELQY